MRTALSPRILSVVVLVATACSALLAVSTPVFAQCAANPPLLNYSGTGRNPCLCLIPNDQAGVVFQPPASDFPLEVLSVNIYWGSTFGGNPSSLEQAIHVYQGGLPNPGAPLFTLPGPTLLDGQMNSFNLGVIPFSQGPVTVTLEILNQSSGQTFASSVVDDAAGCTAGRNVVFTGGQWSDACTAGVNGDWVFELVYRPCWTPVAVETKTWSTIKRLFDEASEDAPPEP
jgi:hypothetical protein